MKMAERDERAETLREFKRFGLSLDHFAGSDVDFVCHALNLFLAVCGTGVLITNTSTLGEKVRTAETLIAALEDTGLKSGLRAHQISGLDWKALRPVVE